MVFSSRVKSVLNVKEIAFANSVLFFEVSFGASIFYKLKHAPKL
jgi:hypothetical protein